MREVLTDLVVVFTLPYILYQITTIYVLSLYNVYANYISIKLENISQNL